MDLVVKKKKGHKLEGKANIKALKILVCYEDDNPEFATAERFKKHVQ